MMKRAVSGVLLILAFILGTAQSKKTSTFPRVCTARVPAAAQPQNFGTGPADLQARSVILTSYKWPDNATLRVRFLNGSAQQQAKFRQYAATWLLPAGQQRQEQQQAQVVQHMELADLRFQYVNVEPSDIRVSFRDATYTDSGSWSRIGTDAKNVASTRPTMHFGWLDASATEESFRRTITHEVGHALGLVHEHQHPKNGIKWNKKQVYADMAKDGWSQAEVDANIFQAYSKTQTQYSKFDPNSIMIYRIPATWTTNGFSVGWNTYLSRVDKLFIATQYP